MDEVQQESREVRGGRARQAKLSPEERTAFARSGAAARFAAMTKKQRVALAKHANAVRFGKTRPKGKEAA